MTNKGVLIIISGPSGSGKGTIVEKLKNNKNYALSISATTREPREYEKEGVHYFFKSKNDFKNMINNDELLEWAEFCGNFYGTPKEYVSKKINEGFNLVLEIDVQGAAKVKDIFTDAVTVFVIPPDKMELKKRLLGRGTEDENTINKRLKRACEEVELIPKYDYVVINDSIDNAVKDIESIVKVSKMCAKRYIHKINDFK